MRRPATTRHYCPQKSEVGASPGQHPTLPKLRPLAVAPHAGHYESRPLAPRAAAHPAY